LAQLCLRAARLPVVFSRTVRRRIANQITQGIFWAERAGCKWSGSLETSRAVVIMKARRQYRGNS
jgi:hypothetical protein